MTPTLNNATSQNTSSNGSHGSVPPHVTVFPTGNSSAGNDTTDSTVVTVSIIPLFPHNNISANDSNGVPPSKASTATDGSSVGPTSKTNATTNSSAEVVPTKTASVTSQGSTAHSKTPMAVLGSSGGPNPSKAAALPPTVVQLLLRVPLSFRILNRNFSQSLLDPTSKEYRSLSRAVLTMTTCSCRRKSRGKLDLFSTKDSYHPMAQYPPYQSHGRYVSPNTKHNPYSQVRAGRTIAGGGTFTYTNPSASSDNL
uniref:SEA domain-containing protein n=1 Tax=Anas platyrhynchos platyrhynchos TaxID=8840 RepID=A0A493U3J4_ANAPP